MFLPLVGALLLPGGRRSARLGALAIALAVLGMAVALAAQYPPHPMESKPFALTDWHWLDWAGARDRRPFQHRPGRPEPVAVRPDRAA